MSLAEYICSFLICSKLERFSRTSIVTNSAQTTYIDMWR